MQLTPTYHIIRNVYKPRPSMRTIDQTVNHIYAVIEQETGVTKDQLKSGSRKREITYANKIAAYLVYYYTPYGTKKVGLELGGLDHSTILSRIQTLFDLILWDKVYEEQLRRCELAVSSMQKKFVKKGNFYH